MRTYPKLKAAAVQAGPVFMNMEESVNKACRMIKEAADNGANLVAFPESFLPGFPYWCFLDEPGAVMPFTQMLFASAITCPGNELSQICKAAKDNNIYVCMGATEREGSSVYDTQFMIDNKGNIMGKHRKLKPMNSEKMIWGEGDGSTMEVFPTPIGKIGSLISCDHMNPMTSMAMCAQQEEIHVASYPALSDSDFWYRSKAPNMSLLNCYAVSNACFVLLSTQVIDQATIDMICQFNPDYVHRLPTAGTNGLGGGNACIINTVGQIISNTIPEGEDGIVYADLDLSEIGIANFFGDTTGHYCNPAVRLELDRTPKKVVKFKGEQPDYSVSYDLMKEFLKA